MHPIGYYGSVAYTRSLPNILGHRHLDDSMCAFPLSSADKRSREIVLIAFYKPPGGG